MREIAAVVRSAVLFTAAFSLALAGLHTTYDPPRVNVRWIGDLPPATRAAVEDRYRLIDPIFDGGTTWSYALADTTTGNIRELLQDPHVTDTHNIDRATFALASGVMPPPFFGPRWFLFWSALIAGGFVALTVRARRQLGPVRTMLRRAAEAAAAPIVVVQALMTKAVQASGLRAVLRATAYLPGDSARTWTAGVFLITSPLLILLCITLWRTPFPISEIVGLLQDVEELPVTHYLNPDATYYRPVYQIALSGIWNSGAALETRLAAVKLLTIVPILIMVPLLIWHLRPRTVVEAGSATVAAAVLIGSAGFRDNLEIGLSYTIVGMALALIVWVLLNRDHRAWHVPLVIVLMLIAIGFKEQGLVLVPVVLVAAWTQAPSATRGLAAAAFGIGAAYVALRLSATGTWEVFEQDLGLGFVHIDRFTAAARFGDFPYWMYAYNAASTMSNVLFAEPTRGIFRIVLAATDDNLEPWHVVYLGSSIALTGIIAWWGVRSIRNAPRGEWPYEARLVAVLVVAVLASGVLSFNYSRDRLGGMTVVFYAAASYFAVRASITHLVSRQGAWAAVAVFTLVLVAAGWQARAIATLEWARTLSSGNNQAEWLNRLATRRVDYANRPTFMRIMESMVAQGTDPDVPRATRLPESVRRVLGP